MSARRKAGQRAGQVRQACTVCGGPLRVVQVQTVQLQPDDRLVIICPRPLIPAKADQLRQSLMLAFPGRNCVMLNGGLALGAVGGFGNRPPVVIDASQDQQP